jgi:hypothetical protein
VRPGWQSVFAEEVQGVGFFMKKQFCNMSTLILTGSVLLAQSLFAQDQPARAKDSPATGSQSAEKAKTPDRAAAYYHFTLAHMY